MRTPENFVVDVRALVPPKRPGDSALLLRVGSPVFPGMMEQFVHVTAQELARVRVAQESSTRRVGEGAAASEVDPINRLGRGIEQEPDVFFTLAQGFVSPVAFDAKGDFVNIRASGIHLNSA